TQQLLGEMGSAQLDVPNTAISSGHFIAESSGLGKPIAQCAGFGAATVGVDAAAEHNVRPELGASSAAGCLAYEALRYHPEDVLKIDPAAIAKFLNARK
ncbi:MAG: hypothetical protein ACREH9_07150, partial [Pseudomonadota bacterium]